MVISLKEFRKKMVAIEQWDEREKKRLFDMTKFKVDTDSYPINRDKNPVAEYYLGLRVREGLLRAGMK